MSVSRRSQVWYELFNRHAEDLYPGRYTPNTVRQLAEQAEEIQRHAAEKQSVIAAHNYLYPEFHEIADVIGDSLYLAAQVRERKAPRVDFCSVYFMGESAKVIVGDDTRVFVGAPPEVIGCSLVAGTDYRWIKLWKQQNPGGVVVTYVNSSAYMKSLADYVSTSRNTAAVLQHAAVQHPGKRILFAPDKYLGWVMRAMSGLSEGVVQVYDHSFNGNSACCYVHAQMNPTALEEALDAHPDADILIHPECGCASTCYFKVQRGEIPHGKSFFLSTNQMIEHARSSTAQEFVVATELGMIYRLRKEVPHKRFILVSAMSSCRFMKANTFDTLLHSLRNDTLEIILCDDCCNPMQPYQDDRVVHIPRSIAQRAHQSIDRMLAIR